MQIEIIKVGELITFVNSSRFQELPQIPITRLRALSQAHNPRASEDDVALIIAYEDNKLLSFIGLLPDILICERKQQKIWWNSCWWANENEKHNGAMQLFYMASKITNGQLFFPELTPHTTGLLSLMMGFRIVEQCGVRGYLKLNLADILPARKASFKHIRFLLLVLDWLLNFIYKPILSIWKKKLQSKHLSYQIIDRVDEETAFYLAKHNEHELFRRNQTELNWILDYPWITEEPADTNQKYSFSHHVKSFQVFLVKIHEINQMTGFFMLLVRDGNAKLSYCYHNPNSGSTFKDVLYKLLIENNINTFLTFNASIVQAIQKNNHPFVLVREQIKTIAFSKEFKIQTQDIQDGDGDCAFV
ncbi:MAG: hypothetical protein Q7J05_09590 [Paludibacter sp.]|nr:hypothetical protein [Paludibacter sp.]